VRPTIGAMTRKYEQTRRAEQQEETRRRIAAATMELHEEVGPARTTVSAVAQRAGVQRLTVYRHFPDEDSLIDACAAHWEGLHPVPDMGPWATIRDPEERLRTALGAVYAFYGRNEKMLANLLRDAPLIPHLAELMGSFGEYDAALREVLLTGWNARGARRELLRAAIGHALDFEAWRSLARRQGLGDSDAIEVAVATVLCVARGGG
jgi:AcrR family transcriptional regulator